MQMMQVQKDENCPKARLFQLRGHEPHDPPTLPQLTKSRCNTSLVFTTLQRRKKGQVRIGKTIHLKAPLSRPTMHCEVILTCILGILSLPNSCPFRPNARMPPPFHHIFDPPTQKPSLGKPSTNNPQATQFLNSNLAITTTLPLNATISFIPTSLNMNGPSIGFPR
jgi:hypothetical protein